nr:unnamed protein product [Callosobruchus analis]
MPSIPGGPGDEKGYFGPWKTCKLLLYNRERCGKDASRFRVHVGVFIAGIVASVEVAILGVFCFLSVLQLAMLSSKEQVVMKYSIVVISKVALGLLSALLAVVTAILFALQIDRDNSGFEITRGPAFYIQILLIVLNAALFVMSLYDMFFARREGGDPTTVSVPVVGATYGNPGYRDPRTNGGGGISMTDASGKPYASNGSMGSMTTVSTTVGSTNGSSAWGSAGTTTRSPLRSSLKKPKPRDAGGTTGAAGGAAGGLGIQNPGFSGTSPTMTRNGSMKKVRIQTQSTEV